MEEENQVFGHGAENKDDFNSEEKFNIYHKDKEDAEKNIQASAKELNDFFDSLIKDEPNPTEEEVNEGIRKILERAYLEKKPNKSKKVALRVLFIAALLSVLSFSCLFAIGSNHNINIENVFVTFAKDTIKVVFFGEDKEEYIDVKTLLEDLNSNGYENILLPQEFVTKSDEYKVSVPVYSKGVEEIGENSKVSIEFHKNSLLYSLMINKITFDSESGAYFQKVDNVETLVVDGVYIYVFEFSTNISAIRFVNDGYAYFMQSNCSLTEMMNIAQTIIKTEDN